MDFRRESGILLHPTSLPGQFGIGDLGRSAYDFIDFLEKGKQKLWQILPLNPTSFGDSPYQSFSTFAGNPLLISPELLLKEGYLQPGDLENIPYFNPNAIDYGAVLVYKSGLFKKAFAAFRDSAAKAQKQRFSLFCKENKAWLYDFCLFMAIKNHLIAERKYTYLSEEFLAFEAENKETLSPNAIKDCFYGALWHSWPRALALREPAALDAYKEKLSDDIEYYQFLQYEFYREWVLLKKYANNAGIKIIGDLPIFVALDSADAWAHKKLFDLDEKGYPVAVAGVPPDYFSADGQLWGNPLYAWEKHEKSGYHWWIKRIEHTLSNVDILRIDHFRGFESYWTVPFGEKTAVRGEWRKGPGKKLFEEIKKALGDLPIIAEDLGIITDNVEKLRDELGLPGMKVLQFGMDALPQNTHMPHNIKTPNVVFYTGTHDNDTIAGWYRSANAKIRDQARRYMNVSGEDISWDCIRLAFLSVADTVIIPIQDLMGLGSEGRMNTPGVASGNWRFRYTEEMLTDYFAAGLLYLSELTDRNRPVPKTEEREE